ncbi:MAG: hypothetical protein QNJ45_13120 [Ardenticatenaceae bacterium]|nr:hypothetical protein [Ardenticatenaceae bacterium]
MENLKTKFAIQINPLVGFQEPLVGFEDPLFGYKEGELINLLERLSGHTVHGHMDRNIAVFRIEGIERPVRLILDTWKEQDAIRKLLSQYPQLILEVKEEARHNAAVVIDLLIR